MALLSVFVSCFLLLAVSITEVGLVSDMVGFLHHQKTEVKTYRVNWTNNPVLLDALPAHLLVDQGHTTNGAAGYGFVLGVAGLIVAWRQRRRNGKSPSKALLTLTILLLLSTLLTLSALIFTFVVTHQTSGQVISSSVAQTGSKYTNDQWTPENWYKALLNLPLADETLKGTFRTHVHLMEAWRWMLVPLFLVDVLALSLAILAVLRQRKRPRLESGQTDKLGNSGKGHHPDL